MHLRRIYKQNKLIERAIFNRNCKIWLLDFFEFHDENDVKLRTLHFVTSPLQSHISAVGEFVLDKPLTTAAFLRLSTVNWRCEQCTNRNEWWIWVWRQIINKTCRSRFALSEPHRPVLAFKFCRQFRISRSRTLIFCLMNERKCQRPFNERLFTINNRFGRFLRRKIVSLVTLAVWFNRVKCNAGSQCTEKDWK